MFPPRARLPLSLRSSSPSMVRRMASKNASPWPSVQGSPGTDGQPKARAWLGTASRISNFVIIPTALLYAVFVADFGEHEHVFQPPRRWLEAQKASFFSLTPDEQSLTGASPARPEGSDESFAADRSWCVLEPVGVSTLSQEAS
ncbi:hypothetical protein BC628DRAFT_1421980 [Trametes gibbosa]|nr:hypothetical protein BC628DRAFT_1421980 [Trametes gibbosa]